MHAIQSRLGLVPPWIVASPIPLVPAHLRNTILRPEKAPKQLLELALLRETNKVIRHLEPHRILYHQKFERTSTATWST